MNSADLHGIYEGAEEYLQRLVELWMGNIALPHLAQHELPGRSRPDLMLCLHEENPLPWCIVELKPRLRVQTTSVKEFADYFEQCVKYHAHTGLPVFLGPFFIPSMGVIDCLSGGPEPKYATASFSALAGRVNVGLFFIHAEPGYETNPDYWYGLRMTMRQRTVAQWSKHTSRGHVWPAQRIELVDFSGAASKSVRG
jgi:hypothetical protein